MTVINKDIIWYECLNYIYFAQELC
jgi:hypothetical protein